MADKRKPRVLVVDDDAAMAETLAEGLVDRGWDAVAIASSRDAAAALASVDALVTDLRMPHVDGLALLALSRASDPERPVIVMTAFSAIDTAMDAMRHGAASYLTKPFKVDELADALEQALAKR